MALAVFTFELYIDPIFCNERLEGLHGAVLGQITSVSGLMNADELFTG